MSFDFDYIILNFGPINEYIDDEHLDNIIEEIETLIETLKYSKSNHNQTHNNILFELVIAAIELGKPQILDYLSKYEFIYDQIEQFKKHIEEYIKHEEDSGKLTELELDDIVREFEKSIKKMTLSKKFIS